jgi:hypothetical protein
VTLVRPGVLPLQRQLQGHYALSWTVCTSCV